MRPADYARKLDLVRCQNDDATLYVSLELSRSTWLVTSLSPRSDKMSKHTTALSRRFGLAAGAWGCSVSQAYE